MDTPFRSDRSSVLSMMMPWPTAVEAALILPQPPSKGPSGNKDARRR